MHLPIICDAIARGGLAAVRLAILTVGDNDRGRLGGIDLLQAAEAAVAAVEARKCEHQRALLMAISQLVRQLCLGAKARAAGKEVGRLAGRVQFPVDARRRAHRARNPRPQRGGRAACTIHAAAARAVRSYTPCTDRLSQAENGAAHVALAFPPLTPMWPGLAWAMRPSYQSPWRLRRLLSGASQSRRNPPCPMCQPSGAACPLE